MPNQKPPTASPALPERLKDAPIEVVNAFQTLTPKKRAFALALPLAPSQEAAAIEAGFAPSTARKKAGSMAAEIGVKIVVDWCSNQAISSSALSIERLLKELERMIFCDRSAMLDDKCTLKPKSQWPDELKSLISGFEIARGKLNKNKFEFPSKLDAMKEAFKLLSAYPEAKKDDPEKVGYVGYVVVPMKEHRNEDAIEGTARRIEQPAQSSPMPAGAFRLLQD